MKTLFEAEQRQALDEARKVRASKLRYIHFTDAKGALGIVKEKRIWHSDYAAHRKTDMYMGRHFDPSR